jgi:hypothetical protein
MLCGLMFDAPNLTSPEALSTLEIEPGCSQLPLPLKLERANDPSPAAL